MQTYYIIDPRRGAEIPVYKRKCWGQKCPVEPKFSTNEHMMMHLFMAHGFYLLVG